MAEETWAARAEEKLASLAKPPGALGTLEAFAVTLCHQQETLTPAASPACVLVFCADHGVKAAEASLSPFPPSVTQSIFKALAAGVAGAAVLAASAGATCTAVDVGIAGDVSSTVAADGCFVRHDKLALGTSNMLEADAMDEALCARAIAAGRAAVSAEISERGAKVIAVGEVGSESHRLEPGHPGRAARPSVCNTARAQISTVRHRSREHHLRRGDARGSDGRLAERLLRPRHGPG